MKEVSTEFNNDILMIKLSGHIDSANSAEAEAQINAALEGHDGCAVTVDLEDLEYISSAGLRVLLRLKKSHADIKLINASPEVYETFSMTGFTEIMDISKAYRKLSVEGCSVIGQGANGKVYRLDPDTIIKVYYDPDSLPDIQRERELARKAFVLGIPTAIPYDVVKVGEGYGSVFELLNASSFAEIVSKQPDRIDEIVEMDVELLKKIHSTDVAPGELPDMKKTVLGWTDFAKDRMPADLFEKLISLIKNVPDRNTMLHGDYHLKNVMLQDGEALLIDMDTLCMGHPVFEFGTAYLAYLGYSELDHEVVRDFLGIPYEVSESVWYKILELYFGTGDRKVLDEYCERARVISYVRMLRHVVRHDPDNKELIDHTTNRLCSLVEKLDSLDF